MKTSQKSESSRSPFTCASCSIASERHPERNEDTFIADQRRGLVAVFDGVGGSTAGEIAPGIARLTIHRRWKRLLKQLQPESPSTLLEQCDSFDLPGAVLQLVQEAHEHIRMEKRPTTGEWGQRTGTEDKATTVALAVFCQQPDTRGYHVVYAFVGDSGIYLLRADTALTPLTQDDSYLTKLVRDHVITQADALRIDQASQPEELSETELSYFHKRNGINQALGDPEPPVVHLNQLSIYPGDRLLLCTDGIHDNLRDQEIVRRSTPTMVARVLVEQAVQRSRQGESMAMRAKPDDMSAVVVTCNR